VCLQRGTNCCTMPMAKVEFDVDLRCRHSVQDLTIDGKYSGAVIFERTTSKLKFTMAKATFATGLTGGVELCFTLDAASACPSLSDLCRGTACTYAVFNDDFSCCPISAFGY